MNASYKFIQKFGYYIKKLLEKIFNLMKKKEDENLDEFTKN